MAWTALAGTGEGSRRADFQQEDWTVPADHSGGFENDPWLGALDDLADDGELLFPYPSGLP